MLRPAAHANSEQSASQTQDDRAGCHKGRMACKPDSRVTMGLQCYLQQGEVHALQALEAAGNYAMDLAGVLCKCHADVALI